MEIITQLQLFPPSLTVPGSLVTTVLTCATGKLVVVSPRLAGLGVVPVGAAVCSPLLNHSLTVVTSHYYTPL